MRFADVRELSVLVPAHDEVHRIEATLDRILEYLARTMDAFEVIVIDDGSRDGMADLVRARFGDRVRLLTHPRRRGKGAAVRTGVGEASQPWLLYVDADMAVGIDQLERLVEHAKAADLILGSKHLPGSGVRQKLGRRAGGRIGNWLISLLAVRGFSDTQCGFKLIRTEAARRMCAHQRLEGFGFDFELLLIARRLGLRIIEVPVSGEDIGRGSVSLATYLAVLAELAIVVWNRWLGRYPPA
jgi:dolichyl-phosphate beta-glucosyltransferase